MACIAHKCRECRTMWEDNRRGGECPKCGSTDVTSHFDEYEPEPEDIS